MDSRPRKSGLSLYDKLPLNPLRLTVLKLDASSFGIEVAKTGTVRDVKQAVQSAFLHLPNKGPARVSWVHVWEQFCLCFEGHKLLNDTDSIGLFRIKDGDQLQFIRHYSGSYNLIKAHSEKPNFYLDSKAHVSNDYREEQQNDDKNYVPRLRIEDKHEIPENNQYDHVELDNIGVISKCQSRLAHMSQCWFPYIKLSSSRMETEKKSRRSSSRIPYKNSGSFRNVIRFYSNKIDSRRETCKAINGD